MNSATLSKEEFQLFQKLLEAESGLHFDFDRQSQLRTGVTERMAARRVGSVEEYFNLLRFHPEGNLEIKALIDRVTIGETYFFRNQPHFDVLRGHLLPQLAQRKATRIVSVWSAACSTGEEPYSLAITLLETLPEAQRWQISLLATDVNREHLRRAQEAVYGERSVRHVPPQWLEKYFVKRGGRYVLKDVVKQLVRFENHNLVKEPFTRAGMQSVDFLFCRNVTIYFSLETTRRVIDQFADCLATDGHLFIGDAETLWQISDRFAAVEFPSTFAYRLVTARERRECKPHVELPHPVVATPKLHRPEPPRIERRDMTERVRAAAQLADRDNHEEAMAELQRIIVADNLCCDAYYLLGTLYAKHGRLEEAATQFQRTVYVDPTLALGYFSLAMIHRSENRPSRAKREFQNALRAVEGKPDIEMVRLSEDISCGYLRAACRRSLEQLEETNPVVAKTQGTKNAFTSARI